jgi:3-hydroxyisobutyrate dehydrogenase-like beta-hydroxyacid dehydrogenase
MTTRISRTVSILGLGLMGSALAEALIGAGHQVTVWNRTPAKAALLTAKGARAAASATDALAASDVTIVCVTGHAATMAALDGAARAGGERTLVQLSTMTPDESRMLAARAEALGMRYLDGSILGLPTTVRAGSATVIFSGPRDIFDANEALFRALGAPRHLSPEIGAAALFDRVWYAYAYGVLMAFLQGAAMAHALGFSLDTYFDTVKARTPVILGQLMARGEKIAARSYETSDARTDVWADGFEGTLSLCREKAVDDGLPGAVLANLRRAGAAGHGDSDVAAVFEVLIAGGGR